MASSGAPARVVRVEPGETLGATFAFDRESREIYLSDFKRDANGQPGRLQSDGGLHLGDLLAKIDDELVVFLSYPQVLRKLRKRPVLLSFERRSAGTKEAPSEKSSLPAQSNAQEPRREEEEGEEEEDAILVSTELLNRLSATQSAAGPRIVYTAKDLLPKVWLSKQKLILMLVLFLVLLWVFVYRRLSWFTKSWLPGGPDQVAVDAEG